ncbi:MAG: hypothetical protein ACE5EH_04430 [Gammaproteobacteria bacterium]
MSEPYDAETDYFDEFVESGSNELENITVDQWGNEWDSTGDFSDMDFRLVDEEF